MSISEHKASGAHCPSFLRGNLRCAPDVIVRVLLVPGEIVSYFFLIFAILRQGFRSQTATFHQGADSVQETWKFESCESVFSWRRCEGGGNVARNKKTEAANDDSHVCSLRSWSPLRSASRDVEARLVYFIFHIACPHHSLVFQDFCENRFERSDPPNFIAAVFVDLQEAIV